MLLRLQGFSPLFDVVIFVVAGVPEARGGQPQVAADHGGVSLTDPGRHLAVATETGKQVKGPHFIYSLFTDGKANILLKN